MIVDRDIHQIYYRDLHQMFTSRLLLVYHRTDLILGRICIQFWILGPAFTKGLSQVLGLSWLYFYTKVKLKTWLRPFVNTAPEF